MERGDVRRDVLLWTAHHGHRGDGGEVGLEGRAEEGGLGAGLEMESIGGGGLLLYTIGSCRLCRKFRYVTSYF